MSDLISLFASCNVMDCMEVLFLHFNTSNFEGFNHHLLSRSDPWCFQGDQQAPHIPCLLECCSSSVICFSKSIILLWRPLDDLYCSLSFFSSSIVAFKLFISSLNSFRLDLHSSSFPLLLDEPVDLHFQLIFLIPWV